jgi:hypothetical protein
MPQMPSTPKSENVSSGSAPTGMPGGMPEGMGQMIENIMKQIGKSSGSVKGKPSIDIQKLIREFPIDKYRDENGKICCPVPKEVREQLMKRFKK